MKNSKRKKEKIKKNERKKRKKGKIEKFGFLFLMTFNLHGLFNAKATLVEEQ